MTHKQFDAGFELKFLAETGVFEGYASVFNVVDQVEDKIAPGAFRESLAAWHKSGRLPPLLWQHEALEPIGAWREMYEDSHGLFVKGDLFIKDIALAKEAYKLLKENVVTGLSIGYRAQESHLKNKSGAGTAQSNSVRVLTKLDLMEVSLVTFPANDQARVSQVKRLSSGGRMPSAPRAAENDMIGLFSRRLQQATAETKTAILARRLNLSMRQATAEALQKGWARKDEGGEDGEEEESIDGYPPNRMPMDPVEEVDAPPAINEGLGLTEAEEEALAVEQEQDDNADTLEAANNAIGALSSDEGDFLGYTLSSGTANGYPLSDTLDNGFGDDIPEDVADRLTTAGQSIIDHLGDDAQAFQSKKNGNYYMMNDNGDKIRFDIGDPGRQQDRITPDDPHYHFETLDDDGNKIDAGDQHSYYFNDGNDDEEE